ncbi:hypothetical protein ACFE04_001993 [Oxalis oulophora]
MVLPLLKIGTLAVKTLSKPVASRLKHQATLHPRFRQFIINIAQANHRISTQIQRAIYSHATNVEIRPLNEEKAVQAAADLIGEIFVFMVGGAVVIFEWQRSSRSEARKEEQRRKEFEFFPEKSSVFDTVELHWLKPSLAMRQRDEDLAKELELLKQKLEEVEKLAKGQGLTGMFKLRNPSTEEGKLAKAA